jgi:hypothetical protein
VFPLLWQGRETIPQQGSFFCGRVGRPCHNRGPAGGRFGYLERLLVPDWSILPFKPHSPRARRHPPLAAHNLSPVTPHSPLAALHSPLATLPRRYPMRRATLLALLAAVGLIAFGDEAAALLKVDLTGSITSSVATQIANPLPWHGLETMPQHGLETMPQHGVSNRLLWTGLETVPQLEAMPQHGLATMPQLDLPAVVALRHPPPATEDPPLAASPSKIRPWRTHHPPPPTAGSGRLGRRPHSDGRSVLPGQPAAG